jgi:hypothetical protein
MARRINWRTVLSNITEAREELQHLEAMAVDRRCRNEAELEVGLGHAYHHLNSAWHVRHIPTSRYAHLSDREFNQWGRFPKDVWLPWVEPRKARALAKKAASNKPLKLARR